MKTEVGSGKLVADARPGEAAAVRQPKYLDLNWLLRDPQDQRMQPFKDECYTRSDLVDLNSPELGKQFLAGGPGGFSPLCTK